MQIYDRMSSLARHVGLFSATGSQGGFKERVKESRDCQFSFTLIEKNSRDRKLEEFAYTNGGQ